MYEDIENQLRIAIARIVNSDSRRKLIVAGPGTGKTTLFQRILESAQSDAEEPLILTFINNLKEELSEKLSHLARVYTFHGYCHYLLRRSPVLREGLTDQFWYFPKLPSIIKRDWEVLNDEAAPQFVGCMRRAEISTYTAFYLDRSNYYDAVSFDDSVFRVFLRLSDGTKIGKPSGLVLIDEYQDFNRLEALFLELLSEEASVIIAGDDDQALYSQLRGSSQQFIRALHRSGEFDCFDLPFCMRCTKVIVNAVSDVVEQAKKLGKLEGRIDKPYRYFPPRKQEDSKKYPKVKVVQTSTQQKKANYFGRYIEAQISRIQSDEIAEGRRDGFPVVLVIGSVQYLRQIQGHLEQAGYSCDTRDDSESSALESSDAFKILSQDPVANLGWRVKLEVDQPPFLANSVARSVNENISLVRTIPRDYEKHVRSELRRWSKGLQPSEEGPLVRKDDVSLTIKLTSFEGSKGLSAQHVFIVGLHEGEFPHDSAQITDLEICKLIVALTRTRKQCHLMHTRYFSGKSKRPSVFLSWIKPSRKETIWISKDYWLRRSAAKK
jgi:superfamily I DNA/RNA helicase